MERNNEIDSELNLFLSVAMSDIKNENTATGDGNGSEDSVKIEHGSEASGSTVGSNDTNDSTPSGKQKRMGTNFTEEQEEEIVRWFKDSPIFYDQTRRDFKNKAKREKMMNEKAAEFGVPGEHII